MLNVGIINPSWTVQRHNTDHVCVMDFAGMHQHADGLHLAFMGSQMQYLKANLNRISNRLVRRSLFPSIPMDAKADQFHALYRYGHTVLGLCLKELAHPPLMSTVGYPSLREDLALGQHHRVAQAEELQRATQDSSLLHFHTDAMRELYESERPGEAARCVTVPFYLPHLRFVDEADIHRKFEQENTQLLFVGADGVRKGLDELCAALDAIATEPLARKLSAVVISKHKPNCQRFTALRHEVSLPRDEVQALMRQSHLYCMVPSRESFGLVFVEAMAAGCAVIADDDIPRQEILDQGRCGVLLPARRAELMAEAIRSLLADRVRMSELAVSAQRRALARYAPRPVALAYAKAFRRMTNKEAAST